MTPQPGEKADFDGAGAGPTGMKPDACPPESIGSGTDPNAPSTNSPQKQGKPSTDNNLDKPGSTFYQTTPTTPNHLGSGGVSPAPMGMKFSPSGVSQSDAAVRFSSAVGLSLSDAHTSAGFLMPQEGSMSAPNLLESYRLRGAYGSSMEPLVTPIRSVVYAPYDTTVITNIASSGEPILQFDYFNWVLSDPLPSPLPGAWKRITISKVTTGLPYGTDQGWQFDVVYPGASGLSNTSICYISAPGSTTATTVLSSNGHEETWTSTLTGTGINAIRTAHYYEKMNTVLVKHTIDTFSVVPAGGRESLSSSVIDTGSSTLTTTYDYWTAASGTNVGQLLRTVHPDGS